jgi:hypothetical protein
MKDAKITQTEAKAQDSFSATLHLPILYITSEIFRRTRQKAYAVSVEA